MQDGEILPDYYYTFDDAGAQIINTGMGVDGRRLEVNNIEQFTPEQEKLYTLAMKTSLETYNTLVSMGMKKEDARMVLPNACCTNMTVTMNLRELMHLCNERLCTCAQWEIRQVVREMAKQVVEALPFMKDYLVPKCERLGYCNEPKRRSCGRKHIKAEIIGLESNK